MKTCPICGGSLKAVPPSKWLNAEQWEAVKAGDYYCGTCPSNGRGNGCFHYFWATEIEESDRVQCEQIMRL